jgi:hypothetical protein
LLIKRGISEPGGWVDEMLHQHALGRDDVDRMREASHTRPFDPLKFAGAARAYIPRLRHHIYSEFHSLFFPAGWVMTEADDADVTSKFSQIERKRGLSGHFAVYSNDVSQWEKLFS